MIKRCCCSSTICTCEEIYVRPFSFGVADKPPPVLPPLKLPKPLAKNRKRRRAEKARER